MLTYQIERHQTPVYRGKKYSEKPKFVNGSEAHRKFILERNYNAVKDDKKLQPGCEYTVKGHSGIGVILDVTDDYDLITWEGLKVQFIEVWFYEEEKSFMFHPSDLRKFKGNQ